MAAAWSVRRDAPDAEVVLLERANELGGKARTHEEEGWRMEAGPNGFLDDEPALDELVTAAGLSKVRAEPAARRRYIVRDGRLLEVPAHPLKFATGGVLSVPGLLRAAAEPFVSARRDGADETVWEFVRRRLGREAADRLAAPMVLGVFAGDARRLSLPAAFPRVAALEREHGSLLRGMKKGGPRAGGGLTSFEAGMQSLPRELARRAGLDARTGVAVEGIVSADGSWRVRVAGETLAATAVVLAADVAAAVPLLRDAAPASAEALAGIAVPPVAVVALGYGAEAAHQVPAGFGALVPRTEDFRLLGCLWESRIFSGRAPGDGVLVRAMLGGAVDPAAAELDDAELIAVAAAELERLLALSFPPVIHKVFRWPRAIPQFEIGHRERVSAARAALPPGLYLAGNYLDGVSFGRAAASGVAAGAAAAEFVLERPAEGR